MFAITECVGQKLIFYFAAALMFCDSVVGLNVLSLRRQARNSNNGIFHPLESASQVLTDINSHQPPVCFKEVPVKLTENNVYGNGSSPAWIAFEVCCEGYNRDAENWYNCIPDCGDKCINGICLGPGRCECFPGYVKNDDGECITTCPLGCLNGGCLSNGTCICKTGYQFDASKKFCRPICNDCGTGRNCTAPGVCSCPKGYREESGKCIPVCSPKCLHGECVAPNNCSCFTGFNLRNGICQPYCKNGVRCDDGVCTPGGDCSCNPDYVFDNETTSCLPRCNNCENGICVAPGNCQCLRGFVKQVGKCVIPCDGRCHRGVCNQYNKCMCERGGPDALGDCPESWEQPCIEAKDGICRKYGNAYIPQRDD